MERFHRKQIKRSNIVVRSSNKKSCLGPQPLTMAMIDDQNTGTNNVNVGDLLYDTDGTPNNIKDVVLKIKGSTLFVSGVYLKFSSLPTIRAFIAAGNDVPITTLTIQVDIIIDDFDPDTVTWSSAGSLTTRNSTSWSITTQPVNSPEYDSFGDNGDHDLDFNTSYLAIIYDGLNGYFLPQVDIDAGKKIHGFRIGLDGSSYDSVKAQGGLKVATSYVSFPEDIGSDIFQHVLLNRLPKVG